MNVQQRQKHIQLVYSTHVMELLDSHSNPGSSDSDPTPGQSSNATHLMSVSLEDAVQKVNVPLKCLEGIWNKASQLIDTENAIVPAPGQDPEAKMVLSYSGKVPHMVTPKKSGDFSCDSNCPSWKAMGICAHSVAVAEVNNKLPQFLSTKKRKQAINVTNLLTTTMPKGRGRKGGVAPRSKKPSQPITSRIEMSIPNMSTVNTATPSQPQSVVNSAPYNMAPVPVTYGSFAPSPMYGPYPPVQQPDVFGYPCPSPMGYHCPPSTTAFTLCFITGNISTCIGCKNKYPTCTSPQAPQDLCIKHQEWRQYSIPSSATPQSKFGNAYYHCNPQ